MARPTEQDAGAAGPSSLGKALALLDAFTATSPELSIRELSRRAGVARSTTHRLVGELVAWGALERTRDGVRLGVKLFELGTLAPSSITLREAALPFAHHLHEVTRLTVNVAIRDGGEIVYLDKISSAALTVPHSRQGGRNPAHATGLGKAILAFDDPVALDDLLAAPLEAVTPKTIVDPDALRAELARVREQRVAYDVEESRLGLFCVAAPILDPRGRAVGAVSVTGATALDEAQRFAPAVRTTALAIAGRLRRRS
jgi:Transcriptional regulator